MKNEMKINETARPLYRMRVHSSHVVTNHVIRNIKEMSIQPIKNGLEWTAIHLYNEYCCIIN